MNDLFLRKLEVEFDIQLDMQEERKKKKTFFNFRCHGLLVSQKSLLEFVANKNYFI